ncbi:hypothetical protein ACFQ7A_12660 [Streptomyces sp. NPDC056528]|uniref:hypothetical protein n=1 Tax=Streptomyces sp. NPDC056528 TaxID=3345854 RepID=UPI0036AFAFDF
MQPQQPYRPPATTAPEQPRNRTRSVALPLLAGLLLGVAGTGAAWILSAGDGPVGKGPEGDARSACRALDGFDPAKYTEAGPAGEIAVNRYAAAGVLSASAAAGDARYKPLAEAVRRSQQRLSLLSRFDATGKKDLDRARAFCEDL